MGIAESIPENGATLEANSAFKAQYLHNKYQVDCFADDTGLEIRELNNEPGVYSARYAGEPPDSNKNMDLVLTRLHGIKKRDACFRTIITLIMDSVQYQFEGVVEGEIMNERIGKGGFGYDPIFKPIGFQQTFAQMNLKQKNQISHRAIAIAKMVDFLSVG